MFALPGEGVKSDGKEHSDYSNSLLQGDHSRGIFGSSDTQQVLSRSKSPELKGLQLIRSVLRREAEGQQHESPDSCDGFLRRVLKLESPRLDENRLKSAIGKTADDTMPTNNKTDDNEFSPSSNEPTTKSAANKRSSVIKNEGVQRRRQAALAKEMR